MMYLEFLTLMYYIESSGYVLIKRHIMKKKLMIFLSILVLSSAINVAYSKPATNNELALAIRMYKTGNYTQCYTTLNNVIKKDPANAVAYYYLGMTAAHIGKKEEAIANYDRAISLTTTGQSINAYAEKGKRCLEDSEKCQESAFESSLDEFISNLSKKNLSDEVKGDYERLKIEQLKRDMNKGGAIDSQKFKEFKDFSSMNNETPTNDEIVAALRILQKAGIGASFNNDFSMLTGNNSQQMQMLNMLGGSNMNPQLIQALLTNNMSLGF